MNRRFGRVRLCALASAIAAALGSASNAQEAGGAAPLEEITVTGSRIVRRDLEANSPIMTVDQQLFDETMSVGVEHMLNQLPQFVPAVTQFDVQNIQPGPTSTPGASTLSLRGLGSNRNLVLIDGRRGMPVNASGAVDTNTIPAAAIARVETITGGASSVYGADAMAGVVNFILKRDYEGVDLDLRYGSTEEGGGEEIRLAGLYGANLAGDNDGNVLIGFEYANRERVMHVDREFYRNIMAEPTVVGTETGWGATAFVTTSLPGSGLPANAPSAAAVAQVFGVPMSEVTRPGGIGTTGTFYYNYDTPNGTIYRLNAPGSSRYDGPLVLDDGVTYRKYRVELNPAIANQTGSLVENQLLRDVSIPLERWAMFGRGTVGITDGISAFAQVNFSQDETNTLQEEAAASGGRGTQIPYGTGIYAPSVDAFGNTLPSYLPGGAYGLNCPATGGCTNSQAFPVKPELATLLNSRPNPNAPWQLSNRAVGLGPRRTENLTTSYQIVAGFEGELSNEMTWEGYVSWGVTTVDTLMEGYGSLERYRFMTNQPNYARGMYYTGNPLGGGFQAAVVTCTSGLPVMDQFQMSPDCELALAADLQLSSKIDQLVAEYNLQGRLFDMPAGEARFAVGTAYRENSYDFLVDTLATQGSFLDLSMGLYPIGQSTGETSVGEVYGELLLPLLADKGIVDALDLELGYRHSDADPSGTIETYKALFDWRVNDALRLRGGRQIANRAPNIAELYLARTQTLQGSSIADLCSEANQVSALSANPALNPNAAQVKSICRARMGEAGYAAFYDPTTIQPTGIGANFAVINNVGNPKLDNETSESVTLGAVIQLANELSLSIDYYSIKLSQMIAAQSVDSVYTQCFSAEVNPSFDPTTVACLQVQRDPGTGGRAPTDVSYTNLSRLETDGLDAQLNWGHAIGVGNFNLTALITYLNTMQTAVDPEASFREWQGTLGPNDLSGVNGGSYEYRTFTTGSYSRGPWSASLRWRHLPSVASAGSVSGNNTVLPTESYDAFDASGSFRFSDSMTLRFGIDNLLNTDPPITDRTAYSPGANTNAGFYDVLGRRAYVALGMQF
jgi:outer membrane receptor protein involved in Fe transport